MAKTYRLIEVASGETVLQRLQLANTFWRRFRGLQFHRKLKDDEGLLITSCRSIHTHWMWFAIDIACIDSSGKIVAVKQHLKPWRFFVAPPETFAILETASGAAPALATDMQLQVDGASIFAE